MRPVFGTFSSAWRRLALMTNLPFPNPGWGEMLAIPLPFRIYRPAVHSWLRAKMGWKRTNACPFCVSPHSALLDTLVNPLQERTEDWKRTVVQLDKDHAKGLYWSHCWVVYLHCLLQCEQVFTWLWVIQGPWHVPSWETFRIPESCTQWPVWTHQNFFSTQSNIKPLIWTTSANVLPISMNPERSERWDLLSGRRLMRIPLDRAIPHVSQLSLNCLSIHSHCLF